MLNSAMDSIQVEQCSLRITNLLNWSCQIISPIIIGIPKNKENLEKNEIDEEDIKKIILLTKKKFSTKDLSIFLSIIYKKPKKFFYTKLLKMSDNKKN